jgi:hypothetical protein
MSVLPKKTITINKAKTSKRQSKLPLKKEKTPLGKSHIDYLPEDVMCKIYRFKHQLEFKSTLDYIKKIRIPMDNQLVETKIPIKKILQLATNKKQIYIDIVRFNRPISDNAHIIQKQFNTNKIEYHQGFGALCQLEIKFTDKINLSVLDILYIVYTLGMTKRLDFDFERILVNVNAKDIHHKCCFVGFDLAPKKL